MNSLREPPIERRHIEYALGDLKANIGTQIALPLDKKIDGLDEVKQLYEKLVDRIKLLREGKPSPVTGEPIIQVLLQSCALVEYNGNAGCCPPAGDSILERPWLRRLIVLMRPACSVVPLPSRLQFIVVEFDTLARLQQVLDELVALDPKRAQVIHKFDFRKDNAAGLLQIICEKLKAATGSRPAILALVGPDEIEMEQGAPASQRFWKEMNLAREALNSIDAQILLCVERWSYRQALQLADHLLSWAAMQVHLVGASERPVVADRTVLSYGLFGNYKLSPEIARERWSELEQSWRKARELGEPAGGFLQRFFISMLESALSLGDLVLARKTRELAKEHGQFPDEDMPRWHELNLALALAEHEDDLANEHAYKLLDLAENHADERVREER